MHIQEDNPDTDPDDPVVIPPNVLITSPSPDDYVAGTLIITGTAKDIDGTIHAVYLQIDDQDWEIAMGTNTWEYHLNTMHLTNGLHTIKVIAIDNDGFQSGTSRVDIHVSNGPLNLDVFIPDSAYIMQPNHFFAYASGGIPPYNYTWDFGDGTGSLDEHPVHTYPNPGTYQVTVSLTDAIENTVQQNGIITVKENDTIPPHIQLYHPTKGCYLNNQKILDIQPCIILGPIEIIISVIDNQTTVTNIEWYLNNELLALSCPNPVSWTWQESYFGTFDIRIIAEDAAGNQESKEIVGWKLF
jgi:hypothetical protein